MIEKQLVSDICKEYDERDHYSCSGVSDEVIVMRQSAKGIYHNIQKKVFNH